MNTSLVNSLPYLDPLQQIHRSLQEWQRQQRLLESYRVQSYFEDAHKQLKVLQEPAKQIKEALKLLHRNNIQKDILENFRTFQKQLSLVENYRVWVDPLDKIRNDLQKSSIQPAFQQIQEQLREAIASRPWQVEIDLQLELLGKQSQIPSDKAQENQQINSVINDVVDRAISQSNNQLESFLAALSVEFSNVKDKPSQEIFAKYVYPLILAIIFSIINPASDYFVKNELTRSERETKKEIKADVASAVNDANKLADFRFISRKSLEIHQNPGVKSPTLSSLKFGQAVVLIEKKGAWSLIIWSDQSNQVSVKGWVLSRYLSKFD